MSVSASTFDQFVQVLATATINHGFYPARHPTTRTAIERVSGELAKVLANTARDEITLLVVDEELVIDGQPWHRGSRLAAMMLRPLRQSGVERLSFRAATAADEIEDLLEGLCGRGALESSENIVVGKVVLLEGAVDAAEAAAGLEAHIDAVWQGLGSLREGEAGAYAALERALWNVIGTVESRPRRYLVQRSAPDLESRWRRHAVNTMLHALSLGRGVGAAGGGLFEIALSGLLHDVGLWSLAPELWLAADDWSTQQTLLRRSHVDCGAAFLAGIPAMPMLPILVAREHHLSWDGRLGYPRGAGVPNLASQIVAVVDQYEFLVQAHAALGARESQERSMSLLAQRAETTLHPELVGLFLTQLEA